MDERRRRRQLAKRRERDRKSKAEERRQREHAQVAKEIEELLHEFHARLLRSEAKSIGAIYARFSSDFQHSVTEQVRTLLEFAVEQRIFVTLDNIFFDLAERGCKDRRPGLRAMLDALTNRRFSVLLVFATNRLYRKSYKAMKLVEEEIVEQGLRCIFLKPFLIDTSDTKHWRQLLQMHAQMDEYYSTAFADNVRAAQIGMARERLVTNTVTFGYKGLPVDGRLTKKGTPRQRLEVDAQAAEYVRSIFRWFVNDLLPIDEIVRRLNDDEHAPAPPKSIDGKWSRRAVVFVLKNKRHRAVWTCCATEARWLSKQDYSRQIPRPEPLATFVFEDLRLVSDDTWFKAQARLKEFETRELFHRQ